MTLLSTMPVCLGVGLVKGLCWLFQGLGHQTNINTMVASCLDTLLLKDDEYLICVNVFMFIILVSYYLPCHQPS